MYEVKCANPKCNKGKDGDRATVYAYASDRLGTVKATYCSKFCESETRYDKRFIGKRD